MNPLIPFFISLAETLIQEEPEIAAAVAAILSKPNPTPADWLALHQMVLAKSYADYVPASALPAPASSSPSAPAAAASTPVAEQTAATGQASASAIQPYLSDGTKNPAFVE